MIDAELTMRAECDSGQGDVDCHIEVLVSTDPTQNEIDYEEALTELDWLPLGESCYCPVCRYQLHD